MTCSGFEWDTVFQGTVNPHWQYLRWCTLAQSHCRWWTYSQSGCRCLQPKEPPTVAANRVRYIMSCMLNPTPHSGAVRRKSNLITVQGSERDLVGLASPSHELCPCWRWFPVTVGKAAWIQAELPSPRESHGPGSRNKLHMAFLLTACLLLWGIWCVERPASANASLFTYYYVISRSLLGLQRTEIW